MVEGGGMKPRVVEDSPDQSSVHNVRFTSEKRFGEHYDEVLVTTGVV